MTTKTAPSSRKTKSRMRQSEQAFLEATHEIKEKIAHAQASMMDYVKTNPMKAMGFTLLAGVVVAQLMRLRK